MWVIINFIVHYDAVYIRGLTVYLLDVMWTLVVYTPLLYNTNIMIFAVHGIMCRVHCQSQEHIIQPLLSFEFDNMLFVWRRYFDPSFGETNVKLPGLPVFFLMYIIWTSAKWQSGQKSLDMSLWNGHVNVIDHVCVTVRYQWQVRRIIESFWYNTPI